MPNRLSALLPPEPLALDERYRQAQRIAVQAAQLGLDYYRQRASLEVSRLLGILAGSR